jgi:ABC-2 type transport system ATP-binding protein
MAAPAIEFREVTKVYRKRLRGVEVPALTSASFEVLPGEVCAFLGPNGAGKTTSINLLMGFFYADYGEIRVMGYEPGDVRAKQQIGFLPENFAFYKYMNAERLLRFHSALAGIDTHVNAERKRDLINQVKLTGYERLKIGKYSRGMVQRIGIAQALLADPQLLVLDEPTSGLDPSGRKDVRDLLASLRNQGKTVFLSSHLLSEVEQVCDRVIIISRGRVVKTGRIHELLDVVDRVELLATGITPELDQRIGENGGTLAPHDGGVLITVAVAQKREVAEAVWAAGFDVVHMTPMRESLEQLYMKTVGTEGGVA